MLSIVSPAFALAKETNSGFCATLPSLATSLKKSEDTSAKLIAKTNDALAKIKDTWTNADIKRDVARVETEAKIAEKVNIGATADAAKKTALETFKTNINGAVDARKNALDLAVSAYRASVTQAITARKTSIDGILGTYTNAISTALNKVKGDCANGVDSATIKSNFTASQQSAQAKMKNDNANLSNSADVIKTAAETQSNTIKQAEADFKTALEQARTNLKSAK